jgi:MFS transporter, MHS family, proline/betaine transporter
MFLASAVGFVLFTYPLFRLLAAGTFPTAVLGGLAFAGINGLFSGSMAATMVELFPTRTRYTGMAIGYNVGQALLGGTAALVATTLIKLTGDNLAPAWYLTACGIVAALASLFIPARHDRPH